MPTDLYTVPEDNISVRYEAPLLSRDINQKIVSALPHGIYRGFKLGTSASLLTVNIEADSEHSDSVATIETLDGFGISVKVSGVVPIDLSSYTTKTVVIAMFGEYAVGSDTTVHVRAYELSPTDEFTIASELNELVVLGQVVVPASGLIPIANITPDYRSSSWESEAPERLQWIPTLKDPMFLTAEDGYDLGLSRYWQVVESAGVGFFEVEDGGGTPVFGQKSVSIRVTTSPYTAYAYQDVDIPVTPGQYYYIRLYAQRAVTPTIGTISIKLTFADADMGGSTDVAFPIDTSALATGGSWSHVKFAGKVASTGNLQFLRRVWIHADGMGTATAKVYFDALQVYVEALPDDFQRNADTMLDRVCAERLLVVPETSDLAAPGHVFKIVSNIMSLLSHDNGEKDRTFATGNVELGADLDGVGYAVTPRVTAPVNTTTTYTLMWESDPSGGDPVLRWYAKDDGAFVITYNARWDHVGPDWNEDSAAHTARKFVFGDDGLDAYETAGGTGTWGDSSWDNSVLPMPSQLTNLGDNVNGSPAEGALPRISMTTVGGTYTLVMESTVSGGAASRIYTGPLGESVFTYNARWDGSALDWHADVNSINAWKLALEDDGLNGRERTQPHTLGWSDTSWSGLARIATDGSLIMGSSLVSSASLAANTRLKPAIRSGDYTLLLDTDGALATQAKPRIYYGDNHALVITFNALWDGTQWTSDDTGGDDAWKFIFNDSGLNGYSKSAPPATWADSSWDATPPLRLKTNGRLDIGGSLIATNALAAIARLYLSAKSGTYTLLLHAKSGGAGAEARLYNGSGDALVVTYNAEWDGSNWNADSLTDNAQKYSFGGLGITTEYKAFGTASWSDAAWDSTPISPNGPSGIDIGGFVVLGTEFNDDTTDARKARMRADWSGAVGGRTLLFRSEIDTTELRIYNDRIGAQDGDLWITQNAVYGTGGTWSADDSVRDSFALRFSQGVLYLEKNNATAGTWTDTTWDATTQDQLLSASTFRSLVFKTYDGFFEWDPTVAVTYGSTSGNPPYNTNQNNRISAKSITKCWGQITIVSGAITNIQGLNIQSASIATGDLVITPAVGFVQETGSASTSPSGAVAGTTSTVSQMFQCTSFGTTSFTIRVYETSTVAGQGAVTLNGGSVSTVIRFIVVAPQGFSA